MKKSLLVVIGMALLAAPAFAGEWHSGNNNLCSDCHTMHFSQQHSWGDAVAVTNTPQDSGDWLGTTGPSQFLLKLPPNELCLACHDGQTFAPDVYTANFNAAPTQGRAAGALNAVAMAAPYQDWKGHSLGATTTPPGFDPTKIGAGATWYDPAGGLECISCHSQHGSTTSYRNLGPYSLGGAAGNCRPSYVVSTTNSTLADVWVNIAGQTGTVGARTAAEFNPYYDSANVSYNRNDATVGTTKTSNKIDTLCGACHGNFHGGPEDASIGGTVAVPEAFIRHPTAQTTIGYAGSLGYGGHSALSRYTGATTKVKVYASDRTNYSDASPGCVSCHKAHGNQNPFGLVFLSRTATTVGEEGGYKAGQTAYTDTSASAKDGYRNLCGQCHGQGNL